MASDLPSAERILSAFEVGKKMEMGLCFICDELFTVEHQIAHKNFRFIVIEKEDDVAENEEAEQLLNLSSTIPLSCDSSPHELDLVVTHNEADGEISHEPVSKKQKSPTDLGDIVREEEYLASANSESVDMVHPEQNDAPDDSLLKAYAVGVNEDLFCEIDHQQTPLLSDSTHALAYPLSFDFPHTLDAPSAVSKLLAATPCDAKTQVKHSQPFDPGKQQPKSTSQNLLKMHVKPSPACIGRMSWFVVRELRKRDPELDWEKLKRALFEAPLINTPSDSEILLLAEMHSTQPCNLSHTTQPTLPDRGLHWQMMKFQVCHTELHIKGYNSDFVWMNYVGMTKGLFRKMWSNLLRCLNRLFGVYHDSSENCDYALQVFGQRPKWPVAVLTHIIIDERGLKFILGGLSLKAHSLGEQILSVDIDDYHCQSWSFGRKFGVGSGIFNENKSRDEHLASIVDWKNVGHGNYSSTSMLNFYFLGPGNSRRHVHFGVISLILMCFICSCVLDVYEEFREAGPNFCNLRTYLEAVSVFVLDGSMMPIYAHVRTIGVDTAQILREDGYTKVPFNFKEEEHLQEVFATLTYFPQDSWSTVMHSKNLDFDFRLANDGWPNNSNNWFDWCCASDSWFKFYIARKYVSSNNSATEKKLVAYWAYFIDSTDGYLKSLLKSNTLCFYSKYNTYSGNVEFKFQLVNTWTAMYSNYGDPFDTCKLINVMPQIDVGTWIALIDGFDQNRFTNEVGCLFKALIFAVGVIIALISFEFEHTKDIMPIKSLERKHTQLYFITGHLNCYSSYTMLHEALEGTNPLKTLPRTEVEVFTLLLLSSGNGFQVVISCDSLTFTDIMKDALLVPYGFCIIPLVSMFNAKGSPPKFKHVKMDVVLHRKMVYKGNVRTTKVLTKWKDLPPKHGTWKYSSLRTRMFEGAGIVTVNK